MVRQICRSHIQPLLGSRRPSRQILSWARSYRWKLPATPYKAQQGCETGAAHERCICATKAFAVHLGGLVHYLVLRSIEVRVSPCGATGLDSRCAGTALICATSAPGLGLAPATSAPGLRSSMLYLHRDCARPCHIFTGTGLTPSHICTGTGPSQATSAPGLRERVTKHAPRRCTRVLVRRAASRR
jgi:hypothetical protein